MILAMLAVSMVATQPAGSTLRALHTFAAGDVVGSDAVAAVACQVPVARALRYDRELRVVRATRPIEAGQCLLGAHLEDGPVIAPGQQVSAVTKVGAIQVERRVETLQAARPGGKLFVRGQDGAAFSVRYEDIAR